MPHFDIATFPVPRLVQIVADLLSSICKSNDRLPCSSRKISVFDSRAAPPILLEDYLNRILKYTPYTNEVLLCMLIYFDRLAESETNAITLNSLNIHRFIITSIVIATKSTSDIYYRNSRYAKVGGIGLDELYHLEMGFLKLCNFRVHVRLEQLQNYADQIWNLTLNNRNETTNNGHIVTDLITAAPSPPSIDTSSSSSPTIKFPSSISSSSSSVMLPLTPPYDSASIAPPTTATTTHPTLAVTSTKSDLAFTESLMSVSHPPQHSPVSVDVTRKHRSRYHPYNRISSTR